MSIKRDALQEYRPVYQQEPVAANADRYGDSEGVDLRDAGGVLMVWDIGTGGISFSSTNRIDLFVEHSDDRSNWERVLPGDLVGYDDHIVASLRDSTGGDRHDRRIYQASYIGDKRYVRAVTDLVGSHASPTPVAMYALEGHLRRR